ncbi:MAG: ParB/RepB/Spo0J family partition protein [Phycisphaerales bacterium JB038]
MPEGIETTRIDLDRLQAHPANPNVVPAGLLEKLKGHLERSGRYPPIIVRPLGEDYQILDGHHRVQVLRALGHSTGRCDVWPVDDEEALLLVATLNRLAGADDVRKRAQLLATLRERFDSKRLATLLPESSAQIEKLLSLTLPPPEAAPAPNPTELPSTLTFFLSGDDRRRVLSALGELHAERSRALLLALKLAGTDDG